jgi:predicted transcriptional regulator
MSRVNPDELPASMVVLGLLIEQPDQTVRHFGQCIDQRFTSARFSRATAQTALERFTERGWVDRSHEGRSRSYDRYVPLKPGKSAFREWMYDIPKDGPAPALREAMYGRIELCQLKDLPRLKQLAEEEAEASSLLYENATKRLGRHRRSQISRTDYLKRARAILLHVDPMHWATRNKRYELIAEALGEIIEDMRKDGVKA